MSTDTIELTLHDMNAQTTILLTLPCQLPNLIEFRGQVYVREQGYHYWRRDVYKATESQVACEEDTRMTRAMEPNALERLGTYLDRAKFVDPEPTRIDTISE